MLRIYPVRTKKDQKDFVHFPWKIYANDPFWVPPLLVEARSWFSPKHPFYDYGKIEFFLAKKDHQSVGRIAAIHNPLHNEHHPPGDVGFFGFFESINDQTVADALFEAARRWLSEQGLNTIQGPANPSSNYEYGLLTEGFDDAPRLMMTYNPPYYESLILNFGFEKVKTLYAYKVDAAKAVEHPKLQRLVKIVRERTGVVIRSVSKQHLASDIEHFKRIYNAAWEPNWGHVPFTVREIDQMVRSLFPLTDKSLLLFAELDGEVVGKGVAIPDFNLAVQKMNGRLFPFNFLKFYTYQSKIKWARVITLGVLPEHQRKGIDAVLCYELLKNAQKRGILYGEGSWILEDNVMMNRAMENVYGEIYKRYGVFEYKNQP